MSLEKVSDEVKALAAKLEAAFVVDGDGVSTLPKDVFETNLPEGLTIKEVKNVQHTLLNFVDATTLALGNKGITHLAANKEMPSLTTKFRAGNDSISASFTRAVNMRNPGTGEGFVRNGVSNTKLLAGANAKRAGYKLITDDLTERATSAWKQ
jgi:hypothetical protein